MKKISLLSAFAAILSFAAPASAAIITVIDAQVVADGTPVTHGNIRNSVYDDNVTVTSVPTNVTHMVVLRLFDTTANAAVPISSIAVLEATANNGVLPQYNQGYMGLAVNNGSGQPRIELQDVAGLNIPFTGNVGDVFPLGTFTVTLSHIPPAGFYDPSTGNPQVVEFKGAGVPTGGPATPTVMDASSVALVPEPSIFSSLAAVGFLGMFRRRNRRS